MATRAELELAIDNPNARKFLDLLAYTEGTQKNGYNTAFGGGKIADLSAHPKTTSGFTQTDGKKNTTTAAGRYQFLGRTWDEQAKRHGLTDFGPRSQDLAALSLAADRGALKSILAGDFETAVKKTGSTWASLPSSPHPQGKRSWDDVNKFLGQPRPDAPMIAQSVPTPREAPIISDGVRLIAPTTPQETTLFGKVVAAKLPPEQAGAWANAAGMLAAAQKQMQNSGSLFEGVSATVGPLDDDLLQLIDTV